jgi:hypothetical protein
MKPFFISKNIRVYTEIYLVLKQSNPFIQIEYGRAARREIESL